MNCYNEVYLRCPQLANASRDILSKITLKSGVGTIVEGVGGAFGYLGGLAEGAAAGCGGSRRSGDGWVGRGTRKRRSLRPGPRHGLGAGEHALASAGQRAGRPVRQRYE